MTAKKSAPKAPARRPAAPKTAQPVPVASHEVAAALGRQVPNGRVRISLDALRRERDAASEQPVEIEVEQGGEVFTVSRHVFGLRLIRAIGNDELETVVDVLFGGDPRIGTTVDIDKDDVLALMDSLASEFGLAPPESDASANSSAATPTPSRPISSGTTE